MKHQIERQGLYGDLAVYKRQWNEPGLRRYFVLRVTDNRVLEEFRRKESACKWAVANSDQAGV